MNIRRFSSLRSRLLLLAAVAVVPVGISAAYSALQMRQHAVEMVHRNALGLATAAASEQKEMISETRRLLATLALIPQTRDPDPAVCSNQLSTLLGQSPLYANFGVINLNGDIYCSGIPLQGRVNVADRAYFQRTLASRDFAIGDYQVGRITKVAVLVFSHPILDARGKLQGVVFASTPLTWLNRRASEANLPANTTVSVIDPDTGTYLAHYPDSPSLTGKPATGDPVMAALRSDRKEGTTEGRGGDGLPRLYAFTRLQAFPDNKAIYVAIGIPSSTAYAPVDHFLARHLSILAILGTVAVWLAWIGSDALVLRHIRTLLMGTRRLATGDYAVRAPVSSARDELSELGREFNEMAAALEQRDAEIRQAELKLRTITEAAHDAIILMNSDGNIAFWNHAAERMFGYSRAEAMGRGLRHLLVPERYQQAYEMSFQHFLREGRTATIQGKTLELTALNKQGGEIPIELSVSPVRVGDTWGAVGILRDINDRKESELRIAKTNRARNVISACNEALLRISDEQQLLEAVCRIVIERGGYHMAWVGYAENDRGMSVRPMAWDGHEDGYLSIARFSWTEDTQGTSRAPGAVIRTGERMLIQDFDNPSPNQLIDTDAIRRGYASGIFLPLTADDQPFGVLAIYADKSNAFDGEEVEVLQELANDLSYGINALRTRKQHLRAQEELAHLAFHDTLTGLPNRNMFMQTVDRAIAEAGQKSHSIAVLYIDLNQFKLINDSLGHEYGDELLRKVAARLADTLRKSDIVARQGGDEFIVMLNNPDLARTEHSTSSDFRQSVTQVVKKILKAFHAPFHFHDHEAYVGATIGISLYPGETVDAYQLLQQADSAMYYAKEQGRGSYHFYEKDVSERQTLRLMLETRLHKAIEREEFVLHYQPIVDLKDGQMVGVEALLRWHPEGENMLFPGEFMPVAEDSGLIVPIGNWILEEASRQLAAWRSATDRHLNMAINLSVRQFQDDRLGNKIAEIISKAGITPDLVDLEVTESTMISDPSRMEKMLQSLTTSGMRISLDDFGTGYSSLSRLTTLPIHTLKIDKSFVDGIPRSHDAVAVVTTIVDLASNLGKRSLAEGIETVEQWRYLQEIGCQYGQGYLFSQPVPAMGITRMLEENKTWETPTNN